MDTKAAWRSGAQTMAESEQAESERRLDWVKRALLTCCVAFVANNKQNQTVMVRGSFGPLFRF